MSKPFYASVRNLHLYVGLFLCPFVLVFAFSTLALNHPSALRAVTATATLSPQPVSIAPGAKVATLPVAKDILRQLHVTGEIDFLQHNAKAGRLRIPVSRPGALTTVEVDLTAQLATVRHESMDLASALVYLHKRPGQHNAMYRGNWVYMAIWGWLADATVYGTIFLTITGLYLWWFFKAERRIGWALLGLGVISLAGLALALTIA
jgi:hypothetical protein